MSADESSQKYDPTYRQEDVDATIEEHEARISRLEKAVLIALGYGIAEGANVITDILTYAV